ncbi:MAG TPA: hypothetical protein VHK90_17020, partial [Thermoanaerobaculia bacterium]|nr:hypothetical protein [Thermoanaerobaculia bacterium]
MAAILLPIALCEYWPGPEASRPIAAYLLFLCIACIARWFGFGVAIACTISSAIALWDVVFSKTPAHSAGVQITRLILFLAASFVVAAVSRQKTKEVQKAEQRLQALFDRAIDAIFFFDDTGRY